MQETKSKDTESDVILYAARGNLAKGRLPTISIKVKRTGSLYLMGTALAAHFIPRRINVKSLPFYNDSSLLPCVIAPTKEEAESEFLKIMSSIIEDKKNEIDMLIGMYAEPPTISEASISDNDVVDNPTED